MANLARLSSPTAFRAVFSSGRSHARGVIVLYVSKRADAGPTRVGFVVSRKIGGAVQRNRAKRLLREALRLESGNLPLGVDLVVVARPSIAGASYSDVAADLRSVLDAAGLGNLQ
jgi:ribonuclease P protein component